MRPKPRLRVRDVRARVYIYHQVFIGDALNPVSHEPPRLMAAGRQTVITDSKGPDLMIQIKGRVQQLPGGGDLFFKGKNRNQVAVAVYCFGACRMMISPLVNGYRGIERRIIEKGLNTFV